MWILTMFLFGGYNSNTPAVFAQEYSSRAACEAAYRTNIKVLKDVSISVTGSCTPK